MIKSFKTYTFIKENDFEYIFPSIMDAVHYIKRKNPTDMRFNKEDIRELTDADNDHVFEQRQDPNQFRHITIN